MKRRNRIVAGLTSAVAATAIGLTAGAAGGSPGTIGSTSLNAKAAGSFTILVISAGAGNHVYRETQEAGTNDILIESNAQFVGTAPDCTLENSDMTARCDENAYDGILTRPGRGNDKVLANNTLLKQTKQVGGRGNDTLRGGRKFDFLKGGKGNDSCRGRLGKEIIRQCE